MPEAVKQDRITTPQSNKNRLDSKLKERLGYSGIYSQRNSQHFFSHLSSIEQQKLFKEFKTIYFQIITDYFTEEEQINSQIDRFVEKAFFVNLPMDKVVEMHMQLIDGLARELKIQGLDTEYLKDYRLTLIDVIAHLGEMYRSVLTEKCITVD